MHGESGQAAVEWVALVLTAALALGAAAALRPENGDRELGGLLAERIARTADGATREAAGGDSRRAPPASLPRAAPASPRAAPAAPPPAPAAPLPPSAARAADAFRRLRGVAEVARHAWIVCLGYRRWRYELEHPSAPTEPLPLDEALSIANSCLNPYDYLLEG